MLNLEYTEIDGLLYPNIELGMEDTLERIRLRTQAVDVAQ